MKSKSIAWLGLVIIAGVAGYLVWRSSRLATPAASLSDFPPAKIAASTTSSPTAQVEKSATAPVAPAAESTNSATNPVPAGADPRTTVPTALADTIRLIESKDYVGLWKAISLPGSLKGVPDSVLEAQAEKIKGDPVATGKMNQMLATLHSLQGVSPAYSADGATAIFAPLPGSPIKDKVLFKNVNGLWYLTLLPADKAP